VEDSGHDSDRDPAALTGRTFDVLVIGGGIFGCCAAYDAAQRGLSVAIVERDDWGSATSANSLKMIHGGIRYLQHFDIPRIRHSMGERRAFLRVAPHLCRPLPILVPTYGTGMKSRWAMRIGMGLFDLLTADANRGIADPKRKIPRGRTIGRDALLEKMPGLDADGLTGAAVFADGQMFNPTRLVWAFLQKAIEAGVTAVNHVAATGLRYDGDRVVGVSGRDELTGDTFDIDAKLTLNAAGPYAEKLLAAGDRPLRLDQRITYSRDTAFVVKRQLVDGVHGIALQGHTKDPDALLSRGARHMFIAPWRGFTLVGVWHGVHKGDPDRFHVTEDELRGYLDEMNAIYPAWGLTLDDVTMWNAGLVPFGDNPEDASHLEGDDLKYGHRSHIVDHADQHGVEGLVTLIGVRYTTGRYEAGHAVDLVQRKLGVAVTPCRSADQPVAGGDIGPIDEHVDAVAGELAKHGVPADAGRAVAMHYGSRWRELLAYLEADASAAQPVGGSTTIWAQVPHAVEREMARTLADVVWRRTDLGTGAYPGRAVLTALAARMAAMLGWDEAEQARHVAAVVRRYPAHVVNRIDGAGQAFDAADLAVA